MGTMMVTGIGVVLGVAWLLLLVATGFSAVAVGFGLLALLAVPDLARRRA
jgi:hypothetical protein